MCLKMLQWRTDRVRVMRLQEEQRESGDRDTFEDSLEMHEASNVLLEPNRTHAQLPPESRTILQLTPVSKI